MDQTAFWKNFRLGSEVDIAGRFIYNGLRQLHEMETLSEEEEVFEFLYYISVGMERLLKVAVVLIEQSEWEDQEEFEKSLITHDHPGLLARIRKKRSGIKLAGHHTEFLQLLAEFYKTYRYGRFSVTSTLSRGQEKTTLHGYVEKHLRIDVKDEPLFNYDENNPRIKKFIGKKVGKIVGELYELIVEEAGRLNIYTYELRSDSKADKIFGRKQFDFLTEEVIWRDVLVFIAQSKDTTGHIGFIKTVEPLDLDPGNIVDYLQSLRSDVKKLAVMDEFEHLYKELEDAGSRLEAVNLIGNPLVDFDAEGDADDEHDPQENDG